MYATGFARAQGTLAPLGFTFSPGGLLFPYHVGVAYELQRASLLTPTTPVGGSSAGSIVAAAIACGVDEDAVSAALTRLVADVRGGARLNQALRAQLDWLLPAHAADLAQAHQLAIAYYSVLPRPQACVATEWASKADLADTIAASCNWPLYFSRWPLVWCRDTLAVDGVFAVPRERFGCPPIDAVRTVAVTCLPQVQLPAFGPADLIQPGSADFPLPMAAADWFALALSPGSDLELALMRDLGREQCTHVRGPRHNSEVCSHKA